MLNNSVVIKPRKQPDMTAGLMVVWVSAAIVTAIVLLATQGYHLMDFPALMGIYL